MQAKKGGLHESLGKLSPSEKQIVEYVAIPGMTTKDTARDLGLSPRAVECHRASIMQKLEVANIVELTRLVALSG